MKILAFTDLHGNMAALKRVKKKAEKADLLICAGDFTIFEQKLQKMLNEINKTGKKVLLINGNHEDEETVRILCEKLGNIEFIHKRQYMHRTEKNEYAIIGYGGGGFSTRDKELERFMARHTGKKNLIMVTHAPPHGTKLDFLWEHRGSKSITEAIRKLKPILLICGHFHENFNRKDKMGKSVLLNPGPEGTLIEIKEKN